MEHVKYLGAMRPIALIFRD